MATSLLPSASSVSAVTPTLDELKQKKSDLEHQVAAAIEALIAQTPLLNAPPSQPGQNRITWSSNANIYLNGKTVELNRNSKECKEFQAACSAFSEAATKLTIAEKSFNSGGASSFTPASSAASSLHSVPTGASSLTRGVPAHSTALGVSTPSHLGAAVSSHHSAPAGASSLPPAHHSTALPTPGLVPPHVGGSPLSHIPATSLHPVHPGLGAPTSASSGVSAFGHPPAPHPAPTAPAASSYEPYQWTHLENTMLQREIENLQQQQEELKGYKKELEQTIADQSTRTASLARGMTLLYTLGLSNGEEISREELDQKMPEVEAQIKALEKKIQYYKTVQKADDAATKSLRVKILIERQLINQLRNEINQAWAEKHTRTFIELPVDIEAKETTPTIDTAQNVNMTTHLEALQAQATRLKAILEAAKLLDVKNKED